MGWKWKKRDKKGFIFPSKLSFTAFIPVSSVRAFWNFIHPWVCPPLRLNYMDSHQETTTKTWWLLHSNAEGCTQHRLERPFYRIPDLRRPTTSLSEAERTKAPFCWTLLQKQRGTGERPTTVGTNPWQTLSWSQPRHKPSRSNYKMIREYSSKTYQMLWTTEITGEVWSTRSEAKPRTGKVRFSKNFFDLFWGIPLWHHNKFLTFFALFGSTYPTDSIDIVYPYPSRNG